MTTAIVLVVIYLHAGTMLAATFKRHHPTVWAADTPAFRVGFVLLTPIVFVIHGVITWARSFERVRNANR